MSICDILDSGEVSGEDIEKPLDVNKYACLSFGSDGRILDVLYPRNTTFYLVFCPPLMNLRPGESSERGYEISMKSGFRRIPVAGTATTTWEANEELDGREYCVLSTELKLEGPSGSSFFSPGPTRFSGKTFYHFDREQGRVVMGVVETELEQTIWVSRVRESFRMTMKLAE